MSKPLLGNLATEGTPDGGLGRRERLTFRGNVPHGRHGWLRLTPAYGLHVVEEILSTARAREVVLDPFSGTGTTVLLSSQRDHPAHAVDINPFLVWLGNLKATRFGDEAPDELARAAEQIVTGLRRVRAEPRVWVPEIHAIEKWWDASVLSALGLLYDRIGKSEKSRGPATADLLRVAFCRTAIETAHVSFAHQSMSFKKRNGASGQLTLLEERDQRTTVWDRFLATVDGLSKSLQESQPLAEARVFLGDSRALEGCLPRQDYTLVVTSPPYPNRMSYIRELRPYMYWLGYLTSGRQAGELDWEAIGGTWGCATSNLGSWEAKSANGIPFKGFARIVEAIGADHPLLGRYVHKYFEDIKIHLSSLSRVLKKGARCYYVVGNSKFYGTLLPVEEIYAALFRDLGYANVHVETIRKRNSKKELFEYVVYAEKP